MRIIYTLFLAIILVSSSCRKPVVEEEEAINAKVSVEITGINTGIIKDELTLFATTQYMKRNVVASPIPAFITQVYIKLGESVKEGQMLYELETKERRALGSQSALPGNSSTETFGKITITAPASGVISTLDKQQIGDYILEGTQLCIIAESGALAFAVNVPFEYIDFTKPGTKCTLLLPDNSQFAASSHIYHLPYLHEYSRSNSNNFGQVQ